MTKRNFLKLLLLLPLSSLHARKPKKLYHQGHYTQDETLTFSTLYPYAYMELLVLSGEVAVSHTTLQAQDKIIFPYKKISLKVIGHASFVIKEIWS